MMLLAVLATLAVHPTLVRAEEEWRPEEPSEAGWDWARLDTGEWIKGEVLLMQDDIMIFDSDNFDEIEVDWDDVVDLKLARPRVFRRAGRRTYSGMGEVRGGVIRILTPEDEIVEFPQRELVSLVYTSESELRNWRVRIGAFLAARAGNTDQQDLTAEAKIRRHTSFTRWTTLYTGTFSQVDGDSTVNNHRASTEFDYLVSRHFFVRVPSFEFFKDKFQNIEARYTPGASVGYELFDTPVVEHILTLGAAAQITSYEGGNQDTDLAILFSSALSLDLPKDIDLDLNYNLQLIATDIGKTNHNTSAVLSIEIWGPLDLDVGAHWDRIESPQRDQDGVQPKKDDFRLTVGFSLEY